MAVQERLYTADEFWESFGDTKRLELVKGVPVEMSPTGEEHSVVSAWIAYLLLSYVETHDLGEVTAAEGGFVVSRDPDTVRAPDVGFVAKTRLAGPTSERYFPGPPDLAVEVVSPGDSASAIHAKVFDYLRAGTRLVWVVYPQSRTVAVYGPDTPTRFLDIDGTLEGGDVLPGLSLPVREIFKKLRE
jgi:Uma2 family endonuclease